MCDGECTLSHGTPCPTCALLEIKLFESKNSTPPSSIDDANSMHESKSTHESSSTHDSGESNVACDYCPKHIDRQNSKVTTKCTLSNGTPCPPCARQMKLKADIEETKKILDKLIAEEHQARLDMNCVHDPLSRLPTEIVSHIFCFTVPDFELFEKENEMPPSEPDVLVLGAVCHMWREIAWSTPQLWSTIMLSLDWEPTDNMNDVVKEWLERSQNLPLSIRLYLSYHSVCSLDDNEDEHEREYTRQFIKLFIDHSSRWQDLSAQGEQEFLFRYFNQNSNLSPAGPHSLKTLQLLCSTEATMETKFLPCGAKPQPEHIILSGISEFQSQGISWSNATNVTIDGLQIADFYRLVHGAPKLVHLTINNMLDGPAPDEFSVPNPPVALPHLQTFCISTRLKIEFIFDGIKLPSLEKLSICGIAEYWRSATERPVVGPFTSVIHLFERSSCPLTSFILQHGACTYYDNSILELLNALPSTLETLELDVRIPFSRRHRDLSLCEVFSHLARIRPTTSKTPPGLELLPNLESFTYTIFQDSIEDIPWNLLPSIARPVHGEKRPLKNLTILQRPAAFFQSARPILDNRTEINDDVILDLIGLLEGGLELYVVTSLVTCESLHQRLLKLLYPRPTLHGIPIY